MIKHTPTMGRDNPMKYIKTTHPDGIYVQMYREGISISHLFPHNTPMAEVIDFRDKLVAKNKSYFYRLKASHVMKRNQHLPVGVCTSFSKTKNGESYTVSTSVCFSTKDKRHNTKTFYVGTIGLFEEELLEHAELTAGAFRKDYEYCVRHQLDFEGAHAFYKGWKDKHLFDLTRKYRVSQITLEAMKT